VRSTSVAPFATLFVAASQRPPVLSLIAEDVRVGAGAAGGQESLVEVPRELWRTRLCYTVVKTKRTVWSKSRTHRIGEGKKQNYKQNKNIKKQGKLPPMPSLFLISPTRGLVTPSSLNPSNFAPPIPPPLPSSHRVTPLAGVAYANGGRPSGWGPHCFFNRPNSGKDFFGGFSPLASETAPGSTRRRRSS